MVNMFLIDLRMLKLVGINVKISINHDFKKLKIKILNEKYMMECSYEILLLNVFDENKFSKKKFSLGTSTGVQ